MAVESPGTRGAVGTGALRSCHLLVDLIAPAVIV
jgi:hypothetical protein